MNCLSVRIAILVITCFSLNSFSQTKFNYPPTKKTPVVDDYYGTKVTDNYRWLENMNDTAVQNWFKAQGDYSGDIIKRISGRDELYNKFVSFDSIRKASIGGMHREKDRYFYNKTGKGENVSKLYYRDGLHGDEILIFDPSTYEPGKVHTISYTEPSNDGKKIAIGLSEAGSEQSKILIMDVDSKQLYNETIFPSWFGVSDWTDDNTAFIYTLQKSSDLTSKNLLENTVVKFHELGQDPSADRTILSSDDYPELGIVPEDLLFIGYSDDRKFILAFKGGVQQEQICYIAPVSELTSPHINWKPLFKKEDEVHSFVFANDSIYFSTVKDAPNTKILVTSESTPDISSSRVVVSESDNYIKYFERSKNYMFVVFSDGIDQWIKKYNFSDGSLNDVQTPSKGDVYITTYDIYDDSCLVSVSAWTHPTTLYDYEASSDYTNISVFNTSVKYPGMENLVSREVEAKSYDGTTVPLSIVMDKDTKLDGNNICYLTGYGAYGSTTNPYFSFINLALTQKGIIIAYAHVRGGGEKGENWHLAGYKETKPNTWKDFIACGEYLINQRYTSNSKLIGEGTSAGGILIGRAVTERPDLFGAVICNVGVADALRMEQTPNGPNNTREFGTVKDEKECMALLEMDAFLHVKDGVKYPAVLCNTGINDPRVSSWEPGKFAAALQNATSSGKPVLLRVDYNSGHFSMEKLVTFNELADFYSFALWQTGHPDFVLK